MASNIDSRLRKYPEFIALSFLALGTFIAMLSTGELARAARTVFLLTGATATPMFAHENPVWRRRMQIGLGMLCLVVEVWFTFLA